MNAIAFRIPALLGQDSGAIAFLCLSFAYLIIMQHVVLIIQGNKCQSVITLVAVMSTSAISSILEILPTANDF